MDLGSWKSVVVPEKLNADFRWLAMILWLCACFCARAIAVDPNHHISQSAHTAWRVREGAFSGSPIVITQTTDGYLWIGTNLGLVRFDGVRFDSWSAPPGQKLLDPRIFSLLGAHDGSLWIGTGYSISHWKDGQLINYPNLSGRIESLVEDSDGTVWLVRTQATDSMGPLCKIKDDQVQCYGAKDGIPFAMAIYLNAGVSKELWIGGYSELCRWSPVSSKTYFAGTSRNPETFASLRAVATTPDGSVWAAIDRSKSGFQLKHFDHGSWISRNFQAITAETTDVTALFVDRDNALWVGTAHHGIFRVWGNNIDHFGSSEGLTSDAVGRFYQDKEGIVWVVTSDGIDSFHDLQVTSYTKREGLSAASASSVMASHNGTVWIANFKALNFLRDGKMSAIRTGQGLPGSNVTTLFEDHAGRLWAGIDAGLWINDGAGFRPIRRTDGSALGIVFSITEDTHHSIWARAGAKLVRIDGLRVTDEFSSPQISTAYVLAANPKGGIFLGLVNGDLVQYENGKMQILASNEVENTRQIRDLLVEPDGTVWGTNLNELARWKDGVRKNLTTRNGLPCDGIFALVNDSQDSLWLYSRCGLVTIEKSQLD